MSKVFSILLVVTFHFSLAYAQQTTGTISGVVEDATGGVIPGVEITARNTETGADRSVVSDDLGRYRLFQLTPGAYELKAELGGFQTALVQGISLSLAQEAVVGITLRVGEITEQVVVLAEVSLIETTSADVGSLVDNRTISELPLNGRDFIQLAALQEGVFIPSSGNRSRTGDSGLKMSISGTRPHQTAVLLDGTDIKGHYGGTPGGLAGALLGVDTVREFRVITNSYSAEYGRFTGGVILAITKSGTNEIHGTIFEFLRNSALDSRNFFDRDPDNPTVRSSPPPFKRNQFGFTVGGPIRTDKTFFFGSYEGLRERLTTSQIAIFPSEDVHKGLVPPSRGVCPRDILGNSNAPKNSDGLCIIGIDPVISPYLALYAIPQTNEGDGTGLFFFDNPRPLNEDYFVIKMDHRFSESDSFFFRYTLDDSDKSILNEGQLYKIESLQRNQYLTIEEKHLFSPSMLNEFRVAYNRSHSSDDDAVNIAVPQELWFLPDRNRAMGLITMGGGINQLGTTTRTPQDFIQNLFQFMDNLVWTQGNHSLKIGASMSRWQLNMENLARLNGTFAFDDPEDFLINNPNGSTLYFSEPFRAGLRQSLFGLYLQDDFKFRPNLTVNLGVRYEFITSPTEVAGRIGNLQSVLQTVPTLGNPYFENPSLKNFSPRLGFAWDPRGNGKSSIRGGFGLFHDQILSWVYTQAPQRMPPFGIRASFGRDDDIIFPDSLRTITADSPAVQRPSIFFVLDPVQPYLMQWNLNVQQEIFPGTALTATYSGSRGVHLSRTVSVNNAVGVLLPDGRRFFDPANPDSFTRANPAFGGMTTRMWDANSWYNGLKLGLRKRFSSGFQFQLSYAWQKFMDEASNITGSPGDFRTSNVTSRNWQDHTLDRGLSAYHTAQSLTSHWTYELPFGPGRRYGAGLSGVVGKLTEGWQINGILQLGSGSPVDVNGTGSITCELCSSRPSLIPGKSNNPITGDPNAWFGEVEDTYRNQEPGFYGDLGRNVGIGPGSATLDLSLFKGFALSERADLTFRAEFFNILNRTNLSSPLRTRTAFRNGRPSSTFGQIINTSGTSRQIQFALKLVF